jgi:PAS domain S-box-containing protein
VGSGLATALGFFLALLLLVATGTLAGLRLRATIAAGDSSAHTWEVLREVETLLADLTEAESAQRGFILTGSEAYLAPYEKARTDVPADVSRLRQLTMDNPSQQERLRTLAPLIDAKLLELQQTIDLRRRSGEEQALALINTDRGREAMEQIRGILSGVSAEESQLLRRRWATRQSESQMTYRLIAAGSGTATILVALSALALYRLMERRRRAERALRESEARLAVTLNSIGDAVIATDTDGRVVFMNPIAESSTGWPQGDARGHHLEEVFRIVNEESRLTVDHPVEKVLRTGRIVGLANHTVLLSRDGSEIPIDDSAAPIRDGDGEIMGVVLVFRDVTQRREAQKAREMYLASEAANESKDRFLAVLSHELRSPLNAMLGWVRVLQSNGGRQEILGRGLQVLDRNIGMQTKLINELLDMSRVVSGRLALDFEAVDLVPLLRDLAETARPAASQKGLHLQEDLGREASLWVRADGDRLGQVVGNLLDNAFKFTPSGGHVTLTLDREGDAARIRVQDTGHGIAADFLPHVFERFRQADSSSSRTFGGLGIGLAIVEHIVARHDGTVVAESRGVGQGSVFTVRLPLVSPPSEAIAAGIESERDSDGGGPFSVLLVEDDEDTLEALSIALEQSGARVLPARGAHEALRLFAGEKPAVVLSDISMPGGDGYELIREIRARETHYTPAIAMTGHASNSDRSAALAAGFDEYLPKPVDPKEIVRLLRDHARRASA